MQTECSADLFGFTPVEGRKVVAAFDGGTMTSQAGAMLLGATDKQIGLIERFADCFTDYRDADLIEHTVRGLVGQRVFGLAIDHDQLRRRIWAVLGLDPGIRATSSTLPALASMFAGRSLLANRCRPQNT
jgi:hypothetical protein